MNEQKTNEIKAVVDKILTDFKITSPAVPIEKIAKKMGAKVRFSPLDEELSGMIYIKNGTPIIGINSFHAPNRQRFTIAHELGHYVLEHSGLSEAVHVDKILMRGSIAASGTDEIEIEANRFAAEILMPVKFVQDELHGKIFDIDDEKAIQDLAKLFKVSTAVVQRRLGALSY